jgi:hypothetical protein
MELLPPKGEIRLWLYNNGFRGISEQVDFLCASFRQQGYDVSASRHPSPTALNVVIEFFDAKTLPVLQQFCTTHRKRLGVVMTEHIDFVNGIIYFHGNDINSADGHMPPEMKRVRMQHLLLANPHIRFFLRLGDLPSLRGVGDMFKQVPVLTIPYPRIEVCSRVPCVLPSYRYELVFTGAATRYRESVCATLRQRYLVNCPRMLISRRRRDMENSLSKVVLNIPQNPEWKWISPMRIMAAWRCGRPVVNIADGALEGRLANICQNLPPSKLLGPELRKVVENAQETFEAQIDSYERFVASEDNPEFPHAAFSAWRLSECPG